MKVKKLTAKEAKFIEEYLIDLNASGAARRAGYSEKAARHTGFTNLTKVHIQNALTIARQELSRKTGVTAEKVIMEAARVAFSDMKRLADWRSSGVVLKDSDGLAPDDSACVQEVSETTTKDGGTVKIKLHSKMDALDKLCRHLGLFDADNRQRKDEIYVTINKVSSRGDPDPS